MPPKRRSTSKASAMTQAAIKKLVADSVFVALEAQAANMENTDNITILREALIARQCSYKEFMSFQPISFKGSEGAVGLIRCTNKVNVVGGKSSIKLPDDPNMPALEDIVYSDDDEDVDAEADMNNLDASILVSHILTTRVHNDHPVEQII
ncbi:hypothetical protein Tco_1520643, partial [Tanacetum coccineum]